MWLKSEILLYIDNKLSYKFRQDLCIYKLSELESTIIEILNPKKANKQTNKQTSSLVAYTDIQQWILINSMITI